MAGLQHVRQYVISIILFWFIQTVYLDPKMKFLKSARLTAEFLSPTLLPDNVVGSSSDNTVTMANIVAVAGQMTTVDPNPYDNELQPNISTSTSSESNQQNFNTAFQSLSSNSNDSNSTSAENRLRWVDFNRHQPFPSRLPGVPGIPSGFRNTPSTQNPFAIVTTTTAATEQPNDWSNGMYNVQKGNNHNFMTNINKPSNSIGFPLVNPAVDEELLFSMSNANSRLTRVEHIVAECSDEHMKVVVRFNGTFNGLIYSYGYVHDRGCIYVNGTGRSHYEFYIRLNQCGTLGRQEMYHPSIPGEARRRDQLMWNTLSIQYNPMIEEEFDEHFPLTCEYGSDYWKTVSFPSINVEVNTGSPVVFTINPPQCQMEIRRGFGIAGTRTTGPVTVGDPLTLLIHMKSEKVGFDILVKNCVAHNGAQQRMQLIDGNGCVTNDKLISPFRGTYNSDGGHQVSLFAYLKAFRFTGSLALYLECDIHMCHNRCPPQKCYWRNLSKRSANLQSYDDGFNKTAKPLLSESISLYQALEVHDDQDKEKKLLISESIREERKNDDLVCLRSSGLSIIIILMIALICLSIGTCFLYYLRIRRFKLLKSITYLDTNSSQCIPTFDGSRRILCQQHSNTNIDRRSIASGYSDFSSSSSLPTYPAYRGRFFRFY